MDLTQPVIIYYAEGRELAANRAVELLEAEGVWAKAELAEFPRCSLPNCIVASTPWPEARKAANEAVGRACLEY